MAKINPLFKNAMNRKQRTDQNISVEEFMDSIPPEYVNTGEVVIDNTITEVLPVQDIYLDPILESEIVANQLDTMADDVEAGVTSIPAMESYKRMYFSYSALAGYPVKASLEAFKPTKGGRTALVASMRKKANMIRKCVSIGLESYADKVDESVDKMVSNYKQALSKLSATKNTLQHNKDRLILVNQKEAWQLFHMAGELIDLESFGRERQGIEALEALIAEGIVNAKKMIKDGGNDVLLKKFMNIILMDNITVEVKKGRAEFVQAPATEPEREWTSTDWPLHLAYSLLNKNYTSGKGEQMTAVLESSKTFGRVIEETKKLAPVVDRIDKDVTELVKLVKSAPEDRRTEIEKAVAPVLELAAKTVKHVTDLTYGIMKMMSRVDK